VARRAGEVASTIFAIGQYTTAVTFIARLAVAIEDDLVPAKLRSPGRMLRRWPSRLMNSRHSHVANGPIGSMNNLIKRTKRIVFGILRSRLCRARALPCATRTNWAYSPPSDPTDPQVAGYT